MKYQILLLLLVTIISFVFLIASFAEDEQSLALYLPFDEGKGDIAKDASGNGNDGAIEGKAKWVDGKYGSALEFDSKNDYVEIPFSETLNITKDITIEVWVKPTKDYVDEPNAWYYFIFKRGYVWELGWQGWGDSITLKMIPAGQAAVATDCKMSLNKDEWYHITGVKKGTFLGIYVNGEKCNSIDSFPGDIASQSTPITVNFANQDAEHTGFAGILDEVAIFSQALTEEEIQKTMKGILKPHVVEPSGKLTTVWGKMKKYE